MKRSVLAVVVLIVVGAVGFMAVYVADIRPTSLHVDEIPDQAVQRGRAHLQALARAHGAENWQRYQVMDLTFADEWFGMFAGMSIWPNSKQQVSGQFARGSWTSRVEMIDGPDQGTQWGIQSWKTWTARPGEEPVFAHDANIEFTLPTIQYFFEMPLRIQSATIVADAGDETWNGERYHRVFATWETAEPNRKVDQYLLWIDPQTFFLARADYTVRDEGGAFVGSAAYGEPRQVGGVTLAHRITITAPMPGGFEPKVHEMTIIRAAWDTVPLQSLRPDPTLPPEGATKPDVVDPAGR